MQLLNKVNTIEVKRAFVFSQMVRWTKKNKGHITTISKEDYIKKLKEVNKKIVKLNIKKLDKIIGGEWNKRLKAYDGADWYMGNVKTTEVGVWRRAGEMPLEWTNRSLAETAEHVKRKLSTVLKGRRIRAVKAIPGILKTSIDLIQKEKYLLPIVFKGGTGTNGRKLLKYKTRGDIDDGCMRSVALAVSGEKVIKVYIGMPKKIKDMNKK